MQYYCCVKITFPKKSSTDTFTVACDNDTDSDLTSHRMSKRRSQQKANRRYKKADESGDKVMPARSLNSHMAMSSSLDGIFISPRTPGARPPRPPQNGNADSEEVELSLLGEAERRQAAAGLDEDDEVDYNAKRPVSSKDKQAMILLCVLCKRILRIGVRIVPLSDIFLRRPYSRRSGEFFPNNSFPDHSDSHYL
jgi:hypothetical protein